MHLLGHMLMLSQKACLLLSALIHPKGVLSGWGQDCRPVKFINSHAGRRGQWEHGIVPNVLYAEAFRFPITGTNEPIPTPEKQPHTITPFPANFTIGAMQVDKYHSPGNLKPDSFIRWRSAICHFRECASTALEFAFYLEMYGLDAAGLDAAARQWKPIP